MKLVQSWLCATDFFSLAICVGTHMPTKFAHPNKLRSLTAVIVGTFLMDESIGIYLLIGIGVIFMGILIASRDWPYHRSISWRSCLFKMVDHFVVWRQRAAERRHLARLSDSDLKDIGLSRSDVTRDERGEFWRR